jgi:hypothetical protein
MRRAGSRFGVVVLVPAFVLLGFLAAVAGASAQPPRPRLAILDDVECAGLSGRFVALVDFERGGLVLSAARFPGGRSAGRSQDGSFARAVAGFESVRLGLEAGAPDGDIWFTTDPTLTQANGCVAFDKEHFTWESDLLTYTRYLAGLLAEAQRIEPARTGLWVGERTVRLEVSRPGVDRATLAGPEGAMLGYGSLSAPERFVFVPVPLGAAGDRVLLRVLRSEGEAFGGKPMQHLGWTIVRRGEDVKAATEPPFVVRLVAVEEP